MRTPGSRLSTGLLLGAALAFFFDPRGGTRRRHTFRDRVGGALRHAGALLRRKAALVAGHARGAGAKARAVVVRPQADVDDATVRQRILSDALRDVGASTRDIEVEVHGGVATLRGSVWSQTLADDLVARVRGVPGVRAVEPALTVAGSGLEGGQ